MFAAVFNRDISVRSSLKYPQLYRVGQRGQAFTIFRLILKMIEAAFHSAVLYMACNFFYSTVVDRHGQEIDLWSSSFTMFSALILLISVKIALGLSLLFSSTPGDFALFLASRTHFPAVLLL